MTSSVLVDFRGLAPVRPSVPPADHRGGVFGDPRKNVCVGLRGVFKCGAYMFYLFVVVDMYCSAVWFQHSKGMGCLSRLCVLFWLVFVICCVV